MKVSITTLGCKANQYDSFAIEEMLSGDDFQVVPFGDVADACIINTCTVTGRTDAQARQLIRRVRRDNPDATVIVTGCYAQVSPDEVANIAGVDYVLGNGEKERVVEHLLLKRETGGSVVPRVAVADAVTGIGPRATTSPGRTRAYLKVQDGCDNSCSYCIIPTARGESRSMPLAPLLDEIDTLVEKGYEEIVLTGIHLGSYGVDSHPATTITGLVRAIDEQRYPCRFRISSLDPEEVTDELIDVMAGSESICPHLHLPLQSGDDGIIRKMGRHGSAASVTERVEKIVADLPRVAVGVDIIAGFPGEGEGEFANSRDLLADLPLAYMHIFPFSKREGTPAALFTGQVDGRTIKARCGTLKELDGLKRHAFYERHLGGEARVLVEGTRHRTTGLYQGRSENYIPVILEEYDGPANRCLTVTLNEIRSYGVVGAVIKS